MRSLRALILSNPILAYALLAVVLALKAIVPSGYMVSASKDLVLTVGICTENMGGPNQVKLVIPTNHSKDDHSGGQGKESPCAYTGLSQPALGGADDILLAVALVYIVLLGLTATIRPHVRRLPRYWPPLRGPPAFH